MAHSSKVNINHLTRFDGNYYHVWKHRVTLIFKQERILAIVDGTKLKHIAPTTTHIVARAQALLATRPCSIIKWEEQDILVFTLINKCLENNVMSHVQSTGTSRQAWVELMNMFKSEDAITKMYLYFKFWSNSCIKDARR
jgi:hypothetical protein